MEQTFVTLNNGAKMPQFGMGVFMVPEGEETKKASLMLLLNSRRRSLRTGSPQIDKRGAE